MSSYGDPGESTPVPGNYPRPVEHPSIPPGVEQPEMEGAQESPARKAHRRMESRNLQKTTTEYPQSRPSNVHDFGGAPGRARSHAAVQAQSENGSEGSASQSDPDDTDDLDRVRLQGDDGNTYGLSANKTSVQYLYRLARKQGKQIAKQAESQRELREGVYNLATKIDNLMGYFGIAQQAAADQSLHQNLPSMASAKSTYQPPGPGGTGDVHLGLVPFAIPYEGVRLGARENLQQSSPSENFYQAARQPSTPAVHRSAPARPAPTAGHGDPAARRSAPIEEAPGNYQVPLQPGNRYQGDPLKDPFRSNRQRGGPPNREPDRGMREGTYDSAVTQSGRNLDKIKREEIGIFNPEY